MSLILETGIPRAALAACSWARCWRAPAKPKIPAAPIVSSIWRRFMTGVPLLRVKVLFGNSIQEPEDPRPASLLEHNSQRQLQLAWIRGRRILAECSIGLLSRRIERGRIVDRGKLR